MSNNSTFQLPALTEFGKAKLEAAGLPTNFDQWLILVDKLTGSHVNRYRFVKYVNDGCTPDEVLVLRKADSAAERIDRETMPHGDF